VRWLRGLWSVSAFGTMNPREGACPRDLCALGCGSIGGLDLAYVYAE